MTITLTNSNLFDSNNPIFLTSAIGIKIDGYDLRDIDVKFLRDNVGKLGLLEDGEVLEVEEVVVGIRMCRSNKAKFKMYWR